MRNYKKYEEDSWIHEIDLGDGNALFAVLGGHGGKFVNKKGI